MKDRDSDFRRSLSIWVVKRDRIMSVHFCTRIENSWCQGISCQFTSASTASGHCMPLHFGALAASDCSGTWRLSEVRYPISVCASNLWLLRPTGMLEKITSYLPTFVYLHVCKCTLSLCDWIISAACGLGTCNFKPLMVSDLGYCTQRPGLDPYMFTLGPKP